MKKTLLASVAVLALAAGCGDKKTPPPAAQGGPLDLPPAPTHNATATTAAPVVVEPAPTGPAITNTTAKPDTSAAAAAPVAGQKYKVKHGDTLYSLARKAYGDGKQYTKIASANPTVIKNGVLPEGATITIPN